MRKRFLILFALAIVGIFSVTLFTKKEIDFGALKIMTEKGWVSYSPNDNKFIVAFPGNPEFATRQLDLPAFNQSLDYNEYRSEAKDVTYSVSFLDFPSRWRLLGNGTLLRKSFDILLETEQKSQQLVSKTFNHHRGFPTLDYILTEGEKQIAGRLVLAGTTLYRLAMAYPADQKDDETVRQFLESFEIPKKR